MPGWQGIAGQFGEGEFRIAQQDVCCAPHQQFVGAEAHTRADGDDGQAGEKALRRADRLSGCIQGSPTAIHAQQRGVDTANDLDGGSLIKALCHSVDGDDIQASIADEAAIVARVCGG